jgi:hypothetical protein
VGTSLLERLRSLVRWLASLHAPTGRWSALAATGLFLGARLTRSALVYSLAYFAACVILILFAADLAKSFIDPGSFPQQPAPRMSLPMLVFRVLLTLVVGGTYSMGVWVGLGPWLPPIVYPVIAVICLLIAWRNLELWYEQGAEFEQELAEETLRETTRIATPSQPQVR